jgi:PAS domain S-box-containing protein
MSVRDFTKHKQTEKELKASEEQYRALVETTGTGYVIIDTDGRVVDANPEYVRLTGHHTREEIIGRSVVEWTAGYEKEKNVEAVKKCARDGYIRNLEIDYVDSTGKITPVEINATVVQTKGKPQIVTLCRDITDRKAAEKKLMESEEKYRAFFGTSRDCVFITSKEGNWIDLNDAATELFGYDSKEELLRVKIGDLYENHEERGQFTKIIKERGFVKEYPVNLRKKDGSVINSLVTSVARKDKNGNVIGFLGTVRDITGYKRAEEERERIRSWQAGVNRILESVLAPSPLDQKLKIITDGVVETFGADFCRIWLIDKGDLCSAGCMHAEVDEGPHICRFREKCLHLKASSGRYTHIDGKAHRRVPFGAYKIGRIASGEDTKFLTNDVEHDPRVHDHEWAKSLGLVAFSGYRLKPPDSDVLGVFALFTRFPISPDMDAILDGLSRAISLAIQKDIAEIALRESEERFRTILHSMQFGIIVIDAHTHTILDANQKSLDMIGGTKETVVGSVCHSFICPAELGRCPITDLAQIIDSSERILITTRGEKIPILKSVVPTILGGKKVLIESFIDITEQKRAEATLRESEERYRTLAEASPDQIFIVGRDDTMKYVNTAVLKMFRLPYDKVVGTPRKNLFPPDIADAQGTLLKKVFETGEHVQTEEKIHFGTQEFWIDTSSVPLKDKTGNVTAVLGIARDITERKRIEEALRENELRYRSLFEGAAEGILVADIDTKKFLHANPAMFRMLGYSEGELTTLGVEDIHPKESLDYVIGEFIAQARGEKIMVENIPVLRKDKSVFYADIITTRIFIDGRMCNVGFFSDITERKRAEDLLKHFNEDLEQKVKIRTEELNTSLQEKVILLREVHHRVKNNLQIIISLINLQMRQIDDKQLKQIMAETQNRVRAMSFVHEKLYQSESLSHIDLSDYTRFLATQLFSYYEVNSQKVALEIAIGKVMVDINTAIPVGLIINELVSNALKHAFPSDRKGTIIISSRYEDKMLTLVVSDDGIGLRPDLDWKNPESLGLRLVNSLVDQLDGTIELGKEKGTTFIISMHREIG